MTHSRYYGSWPGLLSILALTLVLCGCGIKPSSLKPPGGADPHSFPHSYPSTK
ncbi:MAG: hypothetical protein WC989_03095 [Micavibrio sp.]